MIKNCSPHIFALCSLFVLGSTVITTIICDLSFVCIGTAFILLFLSTLVIKASKNYKMLFLFVSLFICAIAICGAVKTFTDYILFLKSAQMPRTNMYILAAALLVTIVFFCSQNIYEIYKYCLFTAIICGIIIVVCCIGGIKNFNFTTITFQNTNFSDCAADFLPVVVLPLFLQFKTENIKPAFYGTATGFFALIICFFQVYFTLGKEQSISNPYLKAVSVISSGSLFTRLDGLVYFLFFVTALVKTVVCVKTVALTIKYFRQ